MTAPDPRLEEIEGRRDDLRKFDKESRHVFVMRAPTDIAYLLAELRKAQDKLARVEKLIESPFASADKRHYEDDFNRGHVAGYNAAAHLLRAAVADATGGEHG